MLPKVLRGLPVRISRMTTSVPNAARRIRAPIRADAPMTAEERIDLWPDCEPKEGVENSWPLRRLRGHCPASDEGPYPCSVFEDSAFSSS
jgi:hypothetical protein